MKKLIASILFIFISSLGFSQVVIVDEGLEKLGGGYNTSIRVFIPYVSYELLADSWVDFLKENKAKVKKAKEEINAKNVVINGLGADTLTIFSVITAVDSGFQLAAVFMRDDKTVSSKNHPKEASWIIKFFKEWGTKICNQALENKIKDQEDVIKDKSKDKKNLENNTSYLEQSNASMKKQISDNEKRIDDNKIKIKTTIAEMDSVNLLIQQIKFQQQNLK
ncbi:MAG: hypothetical protein ACK44N_10685 [Bacteroidota bacterium]|jgi:hypothetical protein